MDSYIKYLPVQATHLVDWRHTNHSTQNLVLFHFYSHFHHHTSQYGNLLARNRLCSIYFGFLLSYTQHIRQFYDEFP